MIEYKYYNLEDSELLDEKQYLAFLKNCYGDRCHYKLDSVRWYQSRGEYKESINCYWL